MEWKLGASDGGGAKGGDFGGDGESVVAELDFAFAPRPGLVFDHRLAFDFALNFLSRFDELAAFV